MISNRMVKANTCKVVGSAEAEMEENGMTENDCNAASSSKIQTRAQRGKAKTDAKWVANDMEKQRHCSAERVIIEESENIMEMEVQGTEFQSDGEISDSNDSDTDSEKLNESIDSSYYESRQDERHDEPDSQSLSEEEDEEHHHESKSCHRSPRRQKRDHNQNKCNWSRSRSKTHTQSRSRSQSVTP